MCSVGYRPLTEMPDAGVPRQWRHGPRSAVLWFYHLAWWPWYMRVDLHALAARIGQTIRKWRGPDSSGASAASRRNSDAKRLEERRLGVQMAGPSCSRRNVVECCDSSVAESLFVHVCLSDLSFLCPLSRESKGWSGSKLAARVSRVHSSGATPSYGAVRPQPVVRGCLQIASVGLKANRAAWHDLYRDKWSSFSTGARRLL